MELPKGAKEENLKWQKYLIETCMEDALHNPEAINQEGELYSPFGCEPMDETKVWLQSIGWKYDSKNHRIYRAVAN